MVLFCVVLDFVLLLCILGFGYRKAADFISEISAAVVLWV